jgi:hypothetical protein
MNAEHCCIIDQALMKQQREYCEFTYGELAYVFKFLAPNDVLAASSVTIPAGGSSFGTTDGAFDSQIISI